MKFVKQSNFAIIARLIGALFILAFLAACSQSEDQLKIQTQSGEVSFKVELADTATERADGLMFRQDLPTGEGMIFDFQEERDVSFWMRNTFIPLDMIFIDAAGTIVKIHENARPHDETGIPSGQPVRFVLEIAGGDSKKLGINVADKVIYATIP